ncbi:exonuclease domain-containing protein [Frigoribacterium sp. 2-23]|uniref:exonuclease domain-containing protein n=1 Tax=Frigoribacterium sp. 2-23 TaxID=3415006 RepID=UPI003C702243
MAPKGFAVIDFETTGFSPQHHHRVIEVGLVHVSPDGIIEREFETVINPGRDLGPTHLHGLRGADVNDAPPFEAIAGQLIEHLRGRVLVAHNARFETTFLRAELGRLGIDSPIEDSHAICTMKLARTHLPGCGTKLAACCSALGIPLEDAHEALADARATALLFGEYRRMGRHDAAWWRDYAVLAESAVWPKASRRAQAEWMPRRREGSPRIAPPQRQAVRSHATRRQDDKPLTEQALEWLIPKARERFGEQPVAIVEQIARHLITARSAPTQAKRRDARNGSQAHVPVVDLTATGARRAGAQRRFRASPGDVIVLTGVMAEPRDRIEELLIHAGFVVEPIVTKRTALLVAADVDSLSRKARRAREYGIPIVSESAVSFLTDER